MTREPSSSSDQHPSSSQPLTLEQLPVPAALIHPVTWQVQSANANFHQLFATVPSDWTRHEFEFSTAEDRVRLKSLLAAQEKVVGFETQIDSPGGQPVALSLSVNPVVLSDGKSLLICCLDNQACRLARQDLAERSELYRTIVEHASEAFFLIDPDTERFLEFNTNAHRQLGYTRDEFAGKTITELCEHHSKNLVVRRLRTALDGRTTTFDTRHYHKEGHLVDLRVTLSPIWIKGRLLVTAVMRDISEQRQIQDSQQKATQRFLRQTELLNQVYQISANRYRSLDERIREMAEQVGSILGHTQLSVWLLDETRQNLLCRDCYRVSHQLHVTCKSHPGSPCIDAVERLGQRASLVIDPSDQSSDGRLLVARCPFSAPDRLVLLCRIACLGQIHGFLAVFFSQETEKIESDQISFGCQLADQVAMMVHDSPCETPTGDPGHHSNK